MEFMKYSIISKVAVFTLSFYGKVVIAVFEGSSINLMHDSVNVPQVKPAKGFFLGPLINT